MGILEFLFGSRYRGPSDYKRKRKTVEDAQEIEKAVTLIRKNPLMKYTYDNELLDAIKEGQEQLIVNQQLILDSVTVKDKKRGEIGLSDYLTSGKIGLLAQNAFKEAIGLPTEKIQEQIAKEISEEKTLISNQINELKNALKTMQSRIEKKESEEFKPSIESKEVYELQAQVKELKNLLDEEKKSLWEVKPEVIEKKKQEMSNMKWEIQELKDKLEQSQIRKKELEKEIESVQKEKEALPKLKTKGIISSKSKKEGKISKVLKKVVQSKKGATKDSSKEKVTDKILSSSKGIKGAVSSSFEKVSSFFKPAGLFSKNVQFELFVEGNFSCKYPKWPPDINVSEDVILSVSSGPFGVEISAKEILSLTFGAYTNKIITLIKSQLKANILVQTIGVDTAYLEFVFKQGNLYWLYKAKIVECNQKFYTVAVKGVKSEINKIEKISDEVLNSIRCEK